MQIQHGLNSSNTGKLTPANKPSSMIKTPNNKFVEKSGKFTTAYGIYKNDLVYTKTPLRSNNIGPTTSASKSICSASKPIKEDQPTNFVQYVFIFKNNIILQFSLNLMLS